MSYGDIKKKIDGDKQDFEKKSLRCSAYDCPMCWSVSVNGSTLCSWHAWEDPKQWPRISESLRNEGAYALQRTKEVDYKAYPGHPKAWAMRLKDRHEAGEKLSKFQVECYKTALRII